MLQYDRINDREEALLQVLAIPTSRYARNYGWLDPVWVKYEGVKKILILYNKSKQIFIGLVKIA